VGKWTVLFKKIYLQYGTKLSLVLLNSTFDINWWHLRFRCVMCFWYWTCLMQWRIVI